MVIGIVETPDDAWSVLQGRRSDFQLKKEPNVLECITREGQAVFLARDTQVA
jgi:hypothetical protein